MRDGISIAVCLDYQHKRPATNLHQDADAPYVFVGYDAFDVWGHDPAKLREFAAALLEGAEQLETAIDGPAPAAPAASRQTSAVGAEEAGSNPAEAARSEVTK